MHIGSSFLKVDLVGRDDHPAAGHLGANHLRVEVFATRHELHFGSDDALPGGFELSHGGTQR